MGANNSSGMVQPVSAADCLASHTLFNDPVYLTILGLMLASTAIATILLLKIVQFCLRNPVKLHPNLMILVGNVLTIYMVWMWAYSVMCIRTFIMALRGTYPCDRLIPLWLAYLVRMPYYINITGSPMFHCAIMVERVLATLNVVHYERKGIKYGVLSSIIVWILIICFALFVAVTSAMEPDKSGAIVYYALTTKYNAQSLIDVHYCLMALVLCISLADYWLIRMNRRIRSESAVATVGNYSLSKSYQMNENMLTMRIIFPLDFSYTFLFALINILVAFIRSKKEEYGMVVYVRNYEASTLLVFGYVLLTLVVYQYLLRTRLRPNQIKSIVVQPMKKSEADTHFMNLQSQWQ